MSDSLKLLALDEEGLLILSSTLQDATVRVEDVAYLASENRFACVLNRIAREKPRKRRLFRRQRHERRRTGLQFTGVQTAARKKLETTLSGDVVNLLAIVFELGDAPAGTITMIFSGDAQIRLTVEHIEAELTDLGAAWQATGTPKHIV